MEFRKKIYTPTPLPFKEGMQGWFLLICLIIFASCQKGTPLENQPPETNIFVSSINLTGDDRLTSEVTLHWSGDDKDGYLKGFELSFDNTNWAFTTSSDSTFNFDLSAGSDTLDIDFYVRAIDNHNLADFSPAYLKVPIKNSPPEAKFDTLSALPDTAFGLFTVVINASDPDGDESLDSLFFKINAGPWYPLESNQNFLTIVSTDPTVIGQVPGTVYSGPELSQLTDPISGFELGMDNVLYVRAKDNAGLESTIDTSKVFFAKRKTADILIIDTHSGYNSPFLDEPEDVYRPIFQNLGLNFDYVDLEKGNAKNLPPFFYPTFGLYMNFYDKVFWFADKTLQDGQLFLEIGANSIQEYMNQGGKIMISCLIPADFENTSVLTQFSPMDSVSTSPGTTELETDSVVAPFGSFASKYDTLLPQFPITGIEPFYPSDSGNVMFTANVTPDAGWKGTNIVGARTTNQGNTNQVFFTFELNLLLGDPAALEKLFDEVMTNEFNW